MNPNVKPVDFFTSVRDDSGLMIEPEKDEYAFAHLTLQQYLAPSTPGQKDLSRSWSNMWTVRGGRKPFGFTLLKTMRRKLSRHVLRARVHPSSPALATAGMKGLRSLRRRNAMTIGGAKWLRKCNSSATFSQPLWEGPT